MRPHRRFRFVCARCGGVRVPVESTEFVATGRETPALLRAQAERAPERLASLFALLCALGGVAAAATAALFAWVANLGPIPNLVLLLVALLPFVAALVLRLKAGASQRRIAEGITEAWSCVANDMYRARSASLSAPELARTLHIAEPEAEQLLAEAQVEAMLSVTLEPLALGVEAPAGSSKTSAPRLRAGAEQQSLEPSEADAARAEQRPDSVRRKH